ncbi:MAG: inorganic pyrophosphatase [bacterium]|nr:inorganic pyrophosphatase [bacterium]
MTNEFWDYIDRFVQSTKIEIDRPRGTPHPIYTDRLYPMDYGYLAGTMTADGGGIDLWQGSAEPGVTGVIVTVDLLKRDAEIKVLYACTADEMTLAHEFANHGEQRGILIRRS